MRAGIHFIGNCLKQNPANSSLVISSSIEAENQENLELVQQKYNVLD